MTELYLCSAILFTVCLIFLIWISGKVKTRPGGPPREIPKCKPRHIHIEKCPPREIDPMIKINELKHLGMLRQTRKTINIDLE